MVRIESARPRIEVADILRAHGDTYRRRHPVSPEQATVMRHLVQCRTAALGGHVDVCDNRGHVISCPFGRCSRLFRGKFLAGLQQLYDADELDFRGSTKELGDPRAFVRLRRQLYDKEWVVYAKPPFGGAEHVFRYLGRYTHRVAISNARLVSMDEGHVRFRYKDYTTSAHKMMTLTAEEFIRRFLLHVLPKRFVRIRHFGIIAGRNVFTRLERARRLLDPPGHATDTQCEDTIELDAITTSNDEHPGRCPHCRHILTRSTLAARFDGWMRRRTLATIAVPYLDSS